MKDTPGCKDLDKRLDVTKKEHVKPIIQFP